MLIRRNPFASLLALSAFVGSVPPGNRVREIPTPQPSTSQGPHSVRKSRTKQRKNPMHGLCGRGQYVEAPHRNAAFHDDRRRHNEQRRDADMVAAFDAAQTKGV